MVQLLRCPPVSIEGISSYLEMANEAGVFSNFGPCSRLLQARLAERLDVPVKATCLGSNATALLAAACEVVAPQDPDDGRGFFPVFSFFATFSIARMLERKVAWYDVDDDGMPLLEGPMEKADIIYVTAPLGTDSLDQLYAFCETVPGFVVIDAASCLPALIDRGNSLSRIPPRALVVFSLHSTKLLSAGEGGFCIFGEEVPNHLEKLTNFGISEGRIVRWERAWNAKLSEFNAAAGLSSLDELEYHISKIHDAKERANEIAISYGLETGSAFRVPSLTLNLKVNDASAMGLALVKRGYETRQWWSLGRAASRQSHPKSFHLYETLLGLPFDWTCIDAYFHQLCGDIAELSLQGFTQENQST